MRGLAQYFPGYALLSFRAQSVSEVHTVKKNRIRGLRDPGYVISDYAQRQNLADDDMLDSFTRYRPI